MATLFITENNLIHSAVEIIDKKFYNKMPTDICIYPTKKIETNEVIPKHLRSRYWETCELVHLVEFWAHYKKDIRNLDENGFIFRSISRQMNLRGYKVAPQDCRRRLKALNSKYQRELKKREEEQTKNESKCKAKTSTDEEFEEIEKDRKRWHLFDVIDSSMKEPFVDLNEDKHVLQEMESLFKEAQNRPRKFKKSILRKDRFNANSLLRVRIENCNMRYKCQLMRKQLAASEAQLKMMYDHYESWLDMTSGFMKQQIQSQQNDK